MGRRYGPRTSLVANKELRPRTRQRAACEAFGVYRCLSYVSVKKILKAHETASLDVATYFNSTRKNSADITMHDDLGFTYIQKQTVKRQLPNVLARGVELTGLMQII